MGCTETTYSTTLATLLDHVVHGRLEITDMSDKKPYYLELKDPNTAQYQDENGKSIDRVYRIRLDKPYDCNPEAIKQLPKVSPKDIPGLLTQRAFKGPLFEQAFKVQVKYAGDKKWQDFKVLANAKGEPIVTDNDIIVAGTNITEPVFLQAHDTNHAESREILHLQTLWV